MSTCLSVIIPIFRVEAYIERCTRSLMEQTLDDIEFIFVDDCSPDASIAVLQRVLNDYHERQGQVRVLRHTENRGLPAARNTGLAAATGDYIFHCDSDDFLERDALASMYEAAVKNEADIVYTDWYLNYPDKERLMRCPDYKTPEEALRGLLHGTMKYNVWNKLVKRELYNENENGNVSFPAGHGMGEDMTMILLFAKAGRVAYLPKGTYHYVRQNENAFTAARSEVSYDDMRFNAERIIQALDGRVPDEDLTCFKLNVKFPFLISNRREDYERWQTWFPEANNMIPNHKVSTRARLLERCAAHRFYAPLKLHHLLLQVTQR
jgi:glycosyltransferase involved in cell wall biosynthesis